MTTTILQGDALERLRELPSDHFHCVVCSPPYWGLRSYIADGDPLKPLEIGLEETPEQWCARLVEVFREVRRVLRSDGVCLINIGDSYWTGSDRATGRNDTDRETPGGRGGSFRGGERSRRRVNGNGLKPKDLVGQPWLLAQALRAPYYTGRIKNEADRVWLAAMIDAEGCMFIHRRKAGQHNGQGYHRTQDSFGPGLEVANTSRAVVELCMAITGLGSICSQGPEQNGRRKQTLYRWNLRTVECRDVIREIYPHLVAKQHQARLLYGCPSSGDDAAKAHRSLIALHRGEPAEIDFKAPPSMFEPGWYVRGDYIWSKCNPMPESVRDRCTKAHEYVFHLSKSARYFWDPEAIREPASYPNGPNSPQSIASPYGQGFTRRATEHRATFRGGCHVNGEPGASTETGNVYRETSGRNLRSVWTIATEPLPSIIVDGEKLDHFASYPVELARRCILAGTSAKGCCPECGAPWARVVEREDTGQRVKMADGWATHAGGHGSFHVNGREAGAPGQPVMASRTTGWRPTCSHSHDSIPCRVLDPFGGSGRTALAAEELGRDCTLIELNPASVRMARAQLERAKSRRYIGDDVTREPADPRQGALL